MEEAEILAEKKVFDSADRGSRDSPGTNRGRCVQYTSTLQYSMYQLIEFIIIYYSIKYMNR